MKPGRLARRTGLRTVAPLRRRTPLRLRRTAGRRTDASTGLTGASGGVPEAVRLAVFARDRGCVGRHLVPEVRRCWGELQPHHVWRRGRQGPDEARNLVTLCDVHHRWVHEHVRDSEKRGLLAKPQSEAGMRRAVLRRKSWTRTRESATLVRYDHDR